MEAEAEAAAAAVTTAEGSAALVVDAPVVEEQIFKAALHRKKGSGSIEVQNQEIF